MINFQANNFVSPFQLKADGGGTITSGQSSAQSKSPSVSVPKLSMESAEAYLRDFQKLSESERNAIIDAHSATNKSIRAQAKAGLLTAQEAQEARWENGRHFRLIAEATGAESRQRFDERFVSEGYFTRSSRGPSEGQAFTVGDKQFKTRQDAVAHAYHFGSDLLKANEKILESSGILATRDTQIASLKEQLAAGEGDSEVNRKKIAWLENNRDSHAQVLNGLKTDAERAMAALTRMFSQTDNGLSDANGTSPTPNGFKITHGTYGKLMEVSDDGSISMFDSEGTGYSRQEFIDKKPDGMIGEIHNDLIVEEDHRIYLAERAERIEKIKNGEIEGKLLHFTLDMMI